MDRMAIERDFFSVNDRIMAVYPYLTMIMRDWEGENLLVQLLLPLDKSEELDDSSYGKSYTMSVLSIYDVKRYSTTLNFVDEKRKVYTIARNEKGDIINTTSKWVESLKLLVYKRKSS